MSNIDPLADDSPGDSGNMDDLIFGLSELDDANSLEELSQAYAQLLIEQDLLNVDLSTGLSSPVTGPPVSTPGHDSANGQAGPVKGPKSATAMNDGHHRGPRAPESRDVDGYVDLRPMVEAARLGEPEDRVAITPQRILEAILFVGTEDNSPLSGRLLASLMRGISAEEVETMVDDLNQFYLADGSAYRIVRETLGFRMELAPTHASLRQRFYGQVREAKLPQTVIDVLALVAYHQPVAKKQIEKLIGSPCAAPLNQLLRRNLIQVTKESELGMVYRTTQRFLDLFDLDSLDDLPQSESLDADS
jgi:segregation and condensation protein B